MKKASTRSSWRWPAWSASAWRRRSRRCSILRGCFPRSARALGLECRSDDAAALAALGPLNDAPTRQAVLAERALLRGLGGGCLVPIGARAIVEGDRLTLRAAVLAPDGSRRVVDEAEGPAAEAETVGRGLAERLLGQGARELLAMR